MLLTIIKKDKLNN